MKLSLKAARVNAGREQREIAKIMGVSPSAVSLWESGKNEISARNFLRLCELYRVSPTDIFLPE